MNDKLAEFTVVTTCGKFTVFAENYETGVGNGATFTAAGHVIAQFAHRQLVAVFDAGRCADAEKRFRSAALGADRPD